jgi:hypothetical protein
LPKAMGAFSSGNTMPAITSAIRTAPAFSAQPNISDLIAPDDPVKQPFVTDLCWSTADAPNQVPKRTVAARGRATGIRVATRRSVLLQSRRSRAAAETAD